MFSKKVIFHDIYSDEYYCFALFLKTIMYRVISKLLLLYLNKPYRLDYLFGIHTH